MMRNDRSARSMAILRNGASARMGIKDSVAPIGYAGAASPLSRVALPQEATA